MRLGNKHTFVSLSTPSYALPTPRPTPRSTPPTPPTPVSTDIIINCNVKLSDIFKNIKTIILYDCSGGLATSTPASGVTHNSVKMPLYDSSTDSQIGIYSQVWDSMPLVDQSEIYIGPSMEPYVQTNNLGREYFNIWHNSSLSNLPDLRFNGTTQNSGGMDTDTKSLYYVGRVEYDTISDSGIKPIPIHVKYIMCNDHIPIATVNGTPIWSQGDIAIGKQHFTITIKNS